MQQGARPLPGTLASSRPAGACHNEVARIQARTRLTLRPPQPVTSPTPVQRATAVAVTAALLGLLLALPVHGTAAWLRVLQDAAHGPVFAAITIALVVLMTPARPTVLRAVEPGERTRRYLIAFAGAQMLGLAVEVIQNALGRSASLFDLGSNAAGAAVGLAILRLVEWGRHPAPRRVPGPAAWLLASAAIAGLTYLSWRPVEAARAYWHRARAFPVLAAFEVPPDLYLVRADGSAADIVDLPAPWSRHPGERALRLRYDATRGPAVQLLEPARDWRGHAVLAVDVTNAAAAELRLVLRVLDETHDWTTADRLNLPLVIPARSRITVRVSLDAVRSAPQGRPMDLARIANVMVFGPPGGEGELYVSRLWLE